MREFFRGWRRKVGVLTLVLACMVIGEWLLRLGEGGSANMQQTHPTGVWLKLYYIQRAVWWALIDQPLTLLRIPPALAAIVLTLTSTYLILWKPRNPGLMKSIERYAGRVLIGGLLFLVIAFALPPLVHISQRGPRRLSRATAAKLNLMMAKQCLKQGDEREGRELLRELVDEVSDLAEGQEAKEILAKMKP